MKDKIIVTLAVLCLFVAIIFCIYSLAPQYKSEPIKNSYKQGIYVSRVIDGDTIQLSNGEEVRYIGIDTPELREKDGNRWIYNPRPYSESAKAFNQQLVGNKKVRLEFDVQKKDRYNRLLAYIYVEGTMVNLAMLKEGYAMIYTYPPNVRYVEKFLSAQRYARENKKGLWGDLEKGIILASNAKENIGLIKKVEAQVIGTYLSEKVLILRCRHNFKVVIFKDNFGLFPEIAIRSPDTYFKGKTIWVYGLIKEYKGSPEIILNDPSQMEIGGVYDTEN